MTKTSNEKTATKADAPALDAASYKTDYPVQLPSGKWVVIQQMSLSSLVRSGVIPNPLLAAAYRIVEGKYDAPEDDEDEDIEDAEQKAKEKAADPSKAQREYYEALDALMVASVVQPTLVFERDEETEDNVWVGRFLDADKVMVLQYSQSGVAYLDSFRNGAGSEGTGQDSTEVR